MSTAARIEELQSKFAENPRRYFAPLANEYRKAGDLTQAIALCREHLPQQPGHMSGHIVLGQALYEHGELAEAQSVFEAALALDPENLIALRHLGDIARERGDASAARRWYGRVLDADPRNDDIAALLASLAARATPAFSPVVAPTPDEPLAPADVSFGHTPFDQPSGGHDAAAAPDESLLSLDEPAWHTPELSVASVWGTPAAPEPMPVIEAPALTADDLLDLETDGEASSSLVPPMAPDAFAPSASEAPGLAVPLADAIDAFESHDPLLAHESMVLEVPATPVSARAIALDDSDGSTSPDGVGDASALEAELVDIEWPDASAFRARPLTPHEVGDVIAAEALDDREALALTETAFADGAIDLADETVVEPEEALLEEFDAGDAAVVADTPPDVRAPSAISESAVEARSTEIPEFLQLAPHVPPADAAASDAPMTAWEVEGAVAQPLPDAADDETTGPSPALEPAAAVADTVADAEVEASVSDESARWTTEAAAPDESEMAERAVEEPIEAVGALAATSWALDEDPPLASADEPWPTAPEEEREAIEAEPFAQAVSTFEASLETVTAGFASAPDTAEPLPQAPLHGDLEAWSDDAVEPAADHAAAPAFVTETMGELLVAQGLIGQAVSVYEQLVERRPEDAQLQGRLLELRAMELTPSAHRTPVVATPIHTTPLSSTPLSATPVHTTPIRSTPAFGTPTSGAAAFPTPARSATPLSVPVIVAPPRRTARAWLSDVAARQVARRTPIATPVAVGMPTPADGLASLFGASPLPPEDVAARSLASAFGGTVPLDASRPLFDELDATDASEPLPARDEAAAPSPGDSAGTSQSALYSFDRFFPDPATTESAAASAPEPRLTPASPGPATPTASAGEELADFSAWLKGLTNS